MWPVAAMMDNIATDSFHGHRVLEQVNQSYVHIHTNVNYVRRVSLVSLVFEKMLLIRDIIMMT